MFRSTIWLAWLGADASLADIDLRSAVYLAGRLLATLYGVPAGEIRP